MIVSFTYVTVNCVVSVDGDYDDDNETGKSSEAKISAFCGSGTNVPTRVYNLKRHLERNNPKIFVKVKENDQAASLSKTSTSSASTYMKLTGTSSKRQTDMTNFITPDKITITMTAQTFQKSIIDLIIQNSLPLIVFSQPPFLNLTG